MLRNGLVIAALCLLPAVASAQVRGPWELELSGSGVNGNKFNGFQGALNLEIGYFFTDNFEVNFRQSLTYTDIGGKNLNGSSRVGVDFNLPLGDQNQWVPYGGFNIGWVYGDSVRDTGELAPEIGLKFFANSSTFIFIQAEYQFFFKSSSGINNGFKNGEFVYTLGLGFRF